MRKKVYTSVMHTPTSDHLFVAKIVPLYSRYYGKLLGFLFAKL